MIPPVVEIPFGEIFPGETEIRFGASSRQVTPGDIAEIRWGINGTQYDKGKINKGLVIATSEAVVHFSAMPVREVSVTFREGWFERTVHAQAVHGGVALAPTVSRMNFPTTFILSTADAGEQAWNVILIGHDCTAHPIGECTSVYFKKVRERATSAE